MKLTLTPTGWASSGSGTDRQQDQNILRYSVQGLPGNDRVTIDATDGSDSGGIKRLMITRNDNSTGKQYANAESAKQALELGEE